MNQSLLVNLSESALALLTDYRLLQRLPDKFNLERIVETHISLVLIGEHAVLKLKKPVRLGFLDHSQLEARWRSAQAEVILNRRLAADIYLGLVALPNHSESIIDISSLDARLLEISSDFATAEPLVVMKRLPEQRTLKEIIRRSIALLKHNPPCPNDKIFTADNELSASSEIIARLLGNFHFALINSNNRPIKVASTNPSANHSADKIKNFAQLFRDNLKDIQQNNQLLAPEAQVLLPFIATAAEKLLISCLDTLITRSDQGFIVNGHGDLRCEHIFYIASSALAIDCIEFDWDMRQVDVVNDICFLLMDIDFQCTEQGAPVVAKYLNDSFLKTYLECFSPSFRPILFPDDNRISALFKTYRALVRAKVDILQAKAHAANSEGQLEKAEQHIFLAAHYLKLIPSTTIIAFSGLMGTGKSTLAKRFARVFSAPHLQTDALRLAQKDTPSLAAKSNWAQANYSEESRLKVYDQMFNEALSPLLCRQSIIFDASFHRSSQRRRVDLLGEKTNTPTIKIHCLLEREETIRRLDERSASGNSLSEGRAELLDLQAADYEQLSDNELQQYIVIDTGKTLEEQLAEIFMAIISQNASQPVFSQSPP
ncbi:MAG: AAA family ATPase [bacterium]|nr:AAA family ATPase [bacterium]